MALHGRILSLFLVVNVLDRSLLLPFEVNVTPSEPALGSCKLVFRAKIKLAGLSLHVEFHLDGFKVEVVSDDTLFQDLV